MSSTLLSGPSRRDRWGFKAQWASEKSALLARGLAAMEGFGTDRSAKSVVAVGDKDVDSIDKAARLLLHSLVDIDEAQKRVKFKIGSLSERELPKLSDTSRMDAIWISSNDWLRRMYVNELLTKDYKYLILAIDEADKCPVPLARLVRSVGDA